MIIDRFTKFILSIIAFSLCLNALNPWISPTLANANDNFAKAVSTVIPLRHFAFNFIRIFKLGYVFFFLLEIGATKKEIFLFLFFFMKSVNSIIYVPEWYKVFKITLGFILIKLKEL